MEKKEKTRKLKAKPPPSIGADFSGFKHYCSTCIDWLQIDSRGTLKNSHFFITLDTEKKTSVFNKLYQIYENNNYVASIVSEPIEDFLPTDLNLIKLINKELYYQNPIQRIISLSLDHNLTPWRPSRIDIAIDFNTFLGGYLPQNLIKDFFKCKYLKTGTTDFIIQGKQETTQNLHYLKFHKKDSNVDTYLYNKSKEMREVKNKPWITERWEKCGIDMTKDVWRLEFAIHNPHFCYTNKETGEQKQFNYLGLDDQNYLNEILRVLISKYFDFRINTGIKEKRDMPKLKLFHNIKDIKLDFDRPLTKESNKADRNFIKKLKELNNEVREISLNLGTASDELITYYKKTRRI